MTWLETVIFSSVASITSPKVNLKSQGLILSSMLFAYVFSVASVS